MLSKLRQAKLVWPTLATLLALAVLLGLGTWQLERKRWKEDLLAKIADRVAAEPLPIARAADRAQQAATSNTCTCPRPAASTTTRSAPLRPRASGLAWHVYTPLRNRTRAASSGSIAGSCRTPANRPTHAAAGQVPGEAEVRGIVRVPPSKSTVYAAERCRGQSLVLARHARHDRIGLSFRLRVKAMPLFVEADAQPLPPGGLPKGGVTRIVPVQPPPGIRRHLVWHRPDAGWRLSGLRHHPLAGFPARIVSATCGFSRRAGQPPCSPHLAP